MNICILLLLTRNSFSSVTCILNLIYKLCLAIPS
nr:MAG TPA: hypothetical protein [Crassvirales sp.]